MLAWTRWLNWGSQLLNRVRCLLWAKSWIKIHWSWQWLCCQYTSYGMYMYMLRFNHKLRICKVWAHSHCRCWAILLLVGKRCAGWVNSQTWQLEEISVKILTAPSDGCHALHKPVQKFTLVVELYLPVTVIVWVSNSAVVGSKNSQEWPMKVLTIALWLLSCTDIYVLKLTIGKGPTLECVDAQEKHGVSCTMDITDTSLAAL